MSVGKMIERLEREQEEMLKYFPVNRDAEVAKTVFQTCIAILEDESRNDLARLNLDMLDWVTNKNRSKAKSELRVVSVPRRFGFVRGM